MRRRPLRQRVSKSHYTWVYDNNGKVIRAPNQLDGFQRWQVRKFGYYTMNVDGKEIKIRPSIKKTLDSME